MKVLTGLTVLGIVPCQVPIDFSRIFQTGCRDFQHLWTMCILFIETKSTGRPISLKYHSIYCNNCDLLYKLEVQIRSCGSHQCCLPNISSFLPSGNMVRLHFLALWQRDGPVWLDLANVLWTESVCHFQAKAFSIRPETLHRVWWTDECLRWQLLLSLGPWVIKRSRVYYWPKVIM